MKQDSAVSLSFVDSPLTEQLVDQADKCIAAGLRPRMATSYLMIFKLFLAFVDKYEHCCTSCTKDNNSLFGVYSTKYF